jgi:hypothetical protein
MNKNILVMKWKPRTSWKNHSGAADPENRFTVKGGGNTSCSRLQNLCQVDINLSRQATHLPCYHGSPLKTFGLPFTELQQTKQQIQPT